MKKDNLSAETKDLPQAVAKGVRRAANWAPWTAGSTAVPTVARTAELLVLQSVGPMGLLMVETWVQ